MPQQLIQEISQLADTDKSAVIQIYEAFSEGHTVACHDYGDLLAHFSYLVSQGDQIVACFGCDTRPTSHRIQWENGEAYGWCIWDTLFIAQLLSKKAVIYSCDPILEQDFSIHFDSKAFADNVLWFSFPVGSHVEGVDLRSRFCQHVRGFVSKESANQYAADHECIVVDYAVMLQRTADMTLAILP